MPAYTNVTNLPPRPYSGAERDVYLNLITANIPAGQHYVWSGGAELGPGVWVAVDTDVTGALATDTTFLSQVTQKFSYAFATHGGAVSNITLTGGTIPSGAIITGGALRVTRDFVGGAGSQGALSLESAGDIQSAANVTGFDIGTTAPTMSIDYALSSAALLTLPSAIPAITTTAARSVVLAITVNPVTDGAFDLFLTYMIP